MKDGNVTRIAICPVCGKAYAGRPARSRKDDKTLICPDCGIREALATLNVDAEEQEKIIEIIHNHSPRG